MRLLRTFQQMIHRANRNKTSFCAPPSWAHEEARILEIVSKVGLSLRAELSVQEIVQLVTDTATELSGAAFGAFFYNMRDEQGETYTLYTLSGVSREAFENIPMPRQTQLFSSTFLERRTIRLHDVTQSPLSSLNAPYYGMPNGHLPVRSYMAVPVISRSAEVLGALIFGHPEPGVFSERAEKLAQGIGSQAAIAIDNARLYEALKKSEGASKKLAETQAFLADAGQVLGSSLQFETILNYLSKLVVPKISDWCVVQLLQNPSQPLCRHLDSAKAACIRSLFATESPRLHGFATLDDYIRGGQVLSKTFKTEGELRSTVTGCDQLKVLQEVGLYSCLCAPLRVRGRDLGALVLVRTEREFQQEDLELIKDLVMRAALALDNSHLYWEAQNINRVKDEFLATLSHELRTPLNVILGHSELLESELDALSPEVGESVEAIVRNAKMQTQIISDLLDTSAIVTGKIHFTPEMTQPCGILTAAVESVRFAAEAKHIGLQVENAYPGIQLPLDPTRFHQIIWNLLSNAVKFTPPGGLIRVSARLAEDHLLIEVEDTGKGIDPDFLPYVFDRFRQEDSSLTRKFGGLGLGLSIVKQLVELHGGIIKVRSEGKNKGCVFSLLFPGVLPRVAKNETATPRFS